MVLTKNNQNYVSQHHEFTPATSSKPRTVIIVYKEPEVVIVRRYIKTIVSDVNPNDYEKQFGRALLDTKTLLALTRQLNIRSDLITPPRAQ